MKIQAVTEDNFSKALTVYTASWRESHKGICSAEFLRRRDYEGYLRKHMEGLYLLTDEIPVGVIRCGNGELGDLYVRPDSQGQGYGTALLRFALSRGEKWTLSVLSSNSRAIHLYEHMGFRFSGKQTFLHEGLWELEMKYREKDNG